MNKDPDELFEDLAKSCPELMQKSRIGEYMGVGIGWNDLLETLCESIYNPVAQARFRLKAAKEYPRDDSGAYLAECERNYEQAVDELPTIVQIKEKFGTLRFYYDGGNSRVDALVEFAEAMSGKICEECGDKGSEDSVGWIKTHCAKHKRNDPNEYQLEIQEGKVSTQIDDE